MGHGQDHPFQTYDDVSDAATCAPRLAALRAELAKRGLDGFVVPHADEHQGEYLPAHAERLAWLTAFTGSAGAAVVLKDKAAIFVDGRYTLQVRNQTDTIAVRAARPGGGRPARLDSRQSAGGRQAGLRPLAAHRQWRGALCAMRRKKPAARWSPVDSNPIDAVWTDQPAAARRRRPCRMPSIWRAKTARPSAPALAEALKKAGADAAVITLADSVCWLFNIRGGDVPHTPFALAFAILHDDGSADLFLDEEKRSARIDRASGQCRAAA